MALNQCQFIGNLGKDPEVKTMQSGDKVANFSIACTEKWKNKDGEKQERTTWVPVVVWGPLAGVVERYVKKGSKVFVSGKFSVRKWTDKDGNDRYSTEVVLQGHGGILEMLDGAPASGGNSGGGARSGGGDWGGQSRQPDGSRGSPAQTSGGFGDDLDDEIPFISCAGVW